MAKLGCLVSGVVDRVTPNAVYVNGKGYSMGTIFTEHLADHHGIYFFAFDIEFFPLLYGVLLLYLLLCRACCFDEVSFEAWI